MTTARSNERFCSMAACCLALASLDADPGGSQRLGNRESFTESDVLTAEKLELFHKDPFDRMLIAQALMGGLVVITPDRAFDPYPMRSLR